MIKILVVDDEPAISSFIKLSLTKAGYSCDVAFDGAQAADMVDKKLYDLVLLDVMLPYIDGFELMEYIRPLNIPVIFLTAKNEVQDRVKGLRMGADDYIVKPFEVVELLARVDAVLRRNKKTSSIIEINNLRIEIDAMMVFKEGKEIQLTRKEYELLLLFVRNVNMALYRETIYERVWGADFEPGSRTVDLHVQRLRKKVGLEKELQSVNKVGYRLVVTK